MLQGKFVETTETHVSCLVILFFENHVVYDIVWTSNIDWGRPQMTIWCMRIACWIPKATNTNTQECVIIIAFPLQQWLHERALMLCYMYVAFRVEGCICNGARLCRCLRFKVTG